MSKSKNPPPQKEGMSTGAKAIIGVLVVIGGIAILSWFINKIFFGSTIAFLAAVIIVLIVVMTMRSKKKDNPK